MQKVKVIEIGPESHRKSFTLKELNTRVVWDLLNNEQGKGSALFVDRFRHLMGLACPELTQEVLLDLYPSEIEELWQGFEEVNAAFLGWVRRIGLDRALIDAVAEVVKTSIGQFAALLPPGTVQ